MIVAEDDKRSDPRGSHVVDLVAAARSKAPTGTFGSRIGIACGAPRDFGPITFTLLHVRHCRREHRSRRRGAGRYWGSRTYSARETLYSHPQSGGVIERISG